MTARLVIAAGAYDLQLERDGAWAQLARLPGGADALMPPGRFLDAAALERAIEVAEDWLMPHAARLRGLALEVRDLTGRVRAGWREVLQVDGQACSVEQVEEGFRWLVDLATGRWPAAVLAGRAAFVADVVLLRELAHHAGLREVRLA
jgi:hypothetical protein